jgi:hypothetical protein
MALKNIWIKVTQIKKTIRWKRGYSTTAILYPNDNPTSGKWDTDPANDLEDMGLDTDPITSDSDKPKEKTLDSANYSWRRKENILLLKLTGRRGFYDQDKITLNEFKEIRVALAGTGWFSAKGQEIAVDWKIVSHPDDKVPPIKDKVILCRPYRLDGDALALEESKRMGYQVYEWQNNKQELLYVGKSGGADGKKPTNWVARLERDHLRTEWIGEAKLVLVTYGLTEQEAFALEEALIPEAKYNKKDGEHSPRFPEGNTSANALSASKHGVREPFRLVLFDPDMPWGRCKETR